MQAIQELDDMEATEVASCFVQDLVENAPEADFVHLNGKEWLHYSVEQIEAFGPNFVHQLAAAVYAGEIEIIPTSTGVGFRGL